MIKNFFINLIVLVTGVIAMACFVASLLVPCILVTMYGLSDWWFLLLLCWIPEAAIFMTMANERGWGF